MMRLWRSAVIRKIGAGIYAYLPFGYRVLRKIEHICREKMDRAGALELFLPALHPAEYWQRGPRWESAREVMFRVAGAGADETPAKPGEPQLVLGPTHEEIITSLVANANQRMK